MNPKLLHILQHSLGLDQFGQGNQYRNRFFTGPGSDDWNSCLELVAGGHMTDHGEQKMCGGMHCFSVTPNGIDVVALKSPMPPKITPGKQRYMDWLRFDGSLSFIEFLKWKQKQRRDFAD